MTIKLIKCIVFICFSLSISFLSPHVSAVNKNNSKINGDLNIPFNFEIQNVNWTGSHNMKSIVAGIKKAKFEQDQYETTAAYNERTSKVFLTGTVKTDSLMAFKFPIDNQGTLCNKTYNADAQEISINCSTGMKGMFFYPKNSKIIELFTFGVVSSIDKSGYIGTNSFGVKKSITVRRAFGQGLAINNFENFSSSAIQNLTRKLSFTIPSISPNNAKKIISDIGLMFIVKLVEPYLLQDSKSEQPTLSDPIDFKGEYQYLNVVVNQIWIVDLKRGIVLQKLDDFKNSL